MAEDDALGTGRDAPTALRGLLERIVDGLALKGTVNVVEDEGVLRATVDGENLGLLIGRHGQTIDAVQHLAQRIVFRDVAERQRIEIDADGYRQRRAEILMAEADQAAEEALRDDVAVELGAMPASERRFVHEYLRERGDVQTYSEGDEPERHLIVAPLEQ